MKYEKSELLDQNTANMERESWQWIDTVQHLPFRHVMLEAWELVRQEGMTIGKYGPPTNQSKTAKYWSLMQKFLSSWPPQNRKETSTFKRVINGNFTNYCIPTPRRLLLQCHQIYDFCSRARISSYYTTEPDEAFRSSKWGERTLANNLSWSLQLMPSNEWCNRAVLVHLSSIMGRVHLAASITRYKWLGRNHKASDYRLPQTRCKPAGTNVCHRV